LRQLLMSNEAIRILTPNSNKDFQLIDFYILSFSFFAAGSWE